MVVKSHRAIRDGRYLFITLAFVVALSALHLLEGPRNVPPQALFEVIFERNSGSFDQFALQYLRLPRILAVIIAGAALGAAGYLLQTAIGNRLGEPHILGLNAGASLAVVLMTTYPLFPLPALLEPFVASLGAGALFGLVLLLSTAGRDKFNPTRMVFFGIALSALANAVVSAILILDEDTLEQLRFWLIGDSAGVRMAAVAATAPAVVIGLAGALAIMPRLAALTLGEDIARGLGASVRHIRIAALVIAALLCGAAVTLVGPIGFVGLVAPALWPGIHQRPSAIALLLTAVTGALLLLAADALAVGLMAPVELPTGALTGLAGAPFFIWLIARRRA